MMQNSKNLKPLDIMACNSAYKNVTALFTSMEHWAKSFLSDFEKLVY